MSFYNVKSTEQPSTFLFTKFDDDLNIVDDSVYLTSEYECTCPAGPRPSCRHRQMLPSFLATSRIDTDWFFCHDTGDWSQPFAELDDSDVVITEDDLAAAAQAPNSPPSPEEWDAMTMANTKPKPTIDMTGITIMTLEDTEAIHNTIAEAVGEPSAKPSTTKPLRRL